jgi:GTP-binding protein
MIPLPRIALVGRPNVGKSTLFNRICGRRQAITDGRPGSTRDRNYAQVEWQGRPFEMIDTGGLLLGTDDRCSAPRRTRRSWRSPKPTSCCSSWTRARGLLPDDQAIAQRLRRDGKQVHLVVNKVEDRTRTRASSRVSAGARAALISAGARAGSRATARRGARGSAARRGVCRGESRPVSVALVGRPNVGKSSLLNRLVGRERAVVSAVPGTTRDTVDELFERRGRRYRLVDTAGIRRVRLLKENVDHVSVVLARRAIARADVAVLVLDAESGLREMDATIGGELVDAGAGVVIAVNKWDLANERELKERRFTESVRDELKFCRGRPSSSSRRRAGAASGRCWRRSIAWGPRERRAVTTGELNRVVARAADLHVPRPAKGNLPVKILFASQIGTAPPTFALKINAGRGPPLLVPALPGKPDSGGFRLRGHPDSPESAWPAEDSSLVKSRIGTLFRS